MAGPEDSAIVAAGGRELAVAEGELDLAGGEVANAREPGVPFRPGSCNFVDPGGRQCLQFASEYLYTDGWCCGALQQGAWYCTIHASEMLEDQQATGRKVSRTSDLEADRVHARAALLKAQFEREKIRVAEVAQMMRLVCEAQAHGDVESQAVRLQLTYAEEVTQNTRQQAEAFEARCGAIAAGVVGAAEAREAEVVAQAAAFRDGAIQELSRTRQLAEDRVAEVQHQAGIRLREEAAEIAALRAALGQRRLRG